MTARENRRRRRKAARKMREWQWRNRALFRTYTIGLEWLDDAWVLGA